ncbi:APC family permease [Dongia soli]|uniref:APC family permease n=1 Tax=Dongia soli TaxID=600628 RepID=A0ABU5EGZ2_9PROT|nr:APC family permease [Dongia soli]MDY0885631.1 APC family permease [Dongia soli]
MATTTTSHEMVRDVNWTQVVFVAAGVPALVLFSMGGISATVGAPAWLVWTISVLFGFAQSFTYAEIAGLHPSKTGGTAVHGATAWIRYSQILAPLSLWSNWLAWTPVLAIGTGLGAGYLLSIFFEPGSSILSWQVTLLDLGFVSEGLTLRINATFLLGAAIMLVCFAIQHRGILRTAQIQALLTIASLLPLFIVCIIPLLQGKVLMSNFEPFTPLATQDGQVVPGAWDKGGILLFCGGLFIAAWSTYAFETSVCYMSEFKNPGRDMPRAIIVSGLICIVAYIIIPVVFQGVLGTQKMLDPGIADGSGIGLALASMIDAGPIITKLLVLALLLSLILAIMTAMAGSSRTLNQGGQDGWLPRYLGYVNHHGAPTRAMWTDLAFNLVLLAMSNYLFVLAVSNCNYLIFNFLNLNAGWIHRLDNPRVPRPWRCPNWLLALGTILAYVNAFLLGAGANVWGKGTLLAGFISAALVIPFFLYRHYVTDKGVFPAHMQRDLILRGETTLGPKHAGMLPYLALAGGIAACLLGYVIFWR